jgi:hypothetical protein
VSRSAGRLVNFFLSDRWDSQPEWRKEYRSFSYRLLLLLRPGLDRWNNFVCVSDDSICSIMGQLRYCVGPRLCDVYRLCVYTSSIGLDQPHHIEC